MQAELAAIIVWTGCMRVTLSLAAIPTIYRSRINNTAKTRPRRQLGNHREHPKEQEERRAKGQKLVDVETYFIDILEGNKHRTSREPTGNIYNPSSIYKPMASRMFWPMEDRELGVALPAGDPVIGVSGAAAWYGRCTGVTRSTRCLIWHSSPRSVARSLHRHGLQVSRYRSSVADASRGRPALPS